MANDGSWPDSAGGRVPPSYDCPRRTAGSTGRCNGVMKLFSRCSEVQRFVRTFIEPSKPSDFTSIPGHYGPETPTIGSQAASACPERCLDQWVRGSGTPGGCRMGSGQQGRENENLAPKLSFGVAHRRPPWLSMMERLTDRPMPIPSPLDQHFLGSPGGLLSKRLSIHHKARTCR